MLPPAPITNLTLSMLSNNACHPEELLIPYVPTSNAETNRWIDSLDVLHYLLRHPEDRNQLRTEACRRSFHKNETLLIKHPHLTCMLPIGSWDTDYLFVRTIKHQIITQERQKGNYNPPLPTTIHPTHTPFILDPLNLQPNHGDVLKEVAALISQPCEILVLPEENVVRLLPSYETIAED